MALKGLNRVVANLNREIAGLRGATLVGMKKAAALIEGESMEKTPKKYGVLVNSAFSDAEQQGTKIRARVGYTAKYAPFVHEMPRRYNYTSPGTGPKFLQKAVTRSHPMVLKILMDNAKID